MSTIGDGLGLDSSRAPDGGPASVAVTEPAADVVTIQVSGGVMTDTATTIARAFDQAVDTAGSDRLIVVDMSAVTFLSLEGAALLVTLARRCGVDGPALHVRTSPAVRRKLAFTGLDTVIPLAEP